jgi:hypothetical protein
VGVAVGGGAARLAEEREVRRPHGVRRGEERPSEGDPHEHLVAVVADVVDDLVLGEEPASGNTPARASDADDPAAPPVIGIFFARPPMSCFMSKLWCDPEWLTDPAHRNRAHLKKAWCEDVEDRRQPRPRAEAEHHVPQLTDRRVRQHLLMSFCTNANRPEMTIVIAAITTIRLMLESLIEKPSQNTG